MIFKGDNIFPIIKRCLINIWKLIIKDGLVAWAAFIASACSLYMEFKGYDLELSGGVKNLIKSRVIRMPLADSITVYLFYLQITNTGKTPVEINYYELDVMQEGQFRSLHRIVDLNDFVGDSSFFNLTTDVEALIKNQIENVSVIPNGKSASGFYLCAAKSYYWSSEFTSRVRIKCHASTNELITLETDLTDMSNYIDFSLIAAQTGVRITENSILIAQ